MTDTFNRVVDFNTKANKLPTKAGSKEYWLAIENQYKRIEEELNELLEAIQERNIEEVVDAGADLDVVVAGLNFLSGSDYTSVITAVLDNNDLKITQDASKADNWKVFNNDNGIDCRVVETNGYYTVQRNEDNKVLKYGNFPKVDLKEFLPETSNEYYVLSYSEESLTDNAKSYLEANPEIEAVYLEGEQDEQLKEVFSKILAEHQEVVLVINNTRLVDILKMEVTDGGNG